MTQKTSKEEWELRLKGIYETEIEKKKNGHPISLHFCQESKMENIYIHKMAQL